MANANMLTAKQQAMLATAVEHPDGTVRAAGFNHALHAEATAKALLTRGLLQYVRQALGGHGYIYKVTTDGRAALQLARAEVK